MKKKRKVGRPKLNRPPIPRRMISVLKEDADYIQKASKAQRRSVTQVMHHAVEYWRDGKCVYLPSDKVAEALLKDYPDHGISLDTPTTVAGQAELVDETPAPCSSGAGATSRALEQQKLREELGTRTRR